MSGFEAILFDFDGVLVDSEPLHYECWCEIIAPHGLVLTWENYAANCIGVSDRSRSRGLACARRALCPKLIGESAVRAEWGGPKHARLDDEEGRGFWITCQSRPLGLFA